jgi:hypothetical protein
MHTQVPVRRTPVTAYPMGIRVAVRRCGSRTKPCRTCKGWTGSPDDLVLTSATAGVDPKINGPAHWAIDRENRT